MIAVDLNKLFSFISCLLWNSSLIRSHHSVNNADYAVDYYFNQVICDLEHITVLKC